MTILRPHPQPPAKISEFLDGADVATTTARQHRLLTERPACRPHTVAFLREAIGRHHANDDTRKRRATLNEALERQGLSPYPLYPTWKDTRKGNLAEIVLAEYITANEQVSLPIYRLRYNPNVEQSMKGDDVLAFDLDAKPIRILVGESKFRADPRKLHVEEIVEALLRSHQVQIPASLGFIAERLYGEQQPDLARRIEECAIAIARDQVQLDYVGLLIGGGSAARHVQAHTPDGEPRRLVMISLGLDAPDVLVGDCFNGLV